MRSRHWARPPIRDVDARMGGRDTCWCRTCGESFSLPEMLEAHIRYQAEQDSLAGATIRPHRISEDLAYVPGVGEATQDSLAHPTRKAVADFLGTEWFEILVILEGVD